MHTAYHPSGHTASSHLDAPTLRRHASGGITAITRLRLDAALYEPAPPRMPGTIGRPRTKAARLHRFVPQALLCTDLARDPAQIVAWLVRRWCVEVTFQEVRAHLGVETQRQRSDKAVARTTPCLLALFSIVTMLATRLPARERRQITTTAWYVKPQPTFSDALAAVRRALWREQGLRTSRRQGHRTKRRFVLPLPWAYAALVHRGRRRQRDRIGDGPSASASPVLYALQTQPNPTQALQGTLPDPELATVRSRAEAQRRPDPLAR
jgi:hypothetical protein